MTGTVMQLIGMYDSPFVRRVAVSMQMLGFAYEHRNWSVGKDFDAIRRYNPLGRVPTLVLADGASLVESAAILDHLDELAGPAHALLPRAGAARRDALQIMAIATGAAEKGVLQLYERAFRPAPLHHEPWVERCRQQMEAALHELERLCASRPPGAWLVGTSMTQADITLACMFTFMNEALQLDRRPAEYLALRASTQRCEILPVFQSIKADFAPPAP